MISQIQGGNGLGLLLKDPEILELLKKLGDPKQEVDPSSISEGEKIVICEALETLMEDNPSILEVFGIKADSFNFCDLSKVAETTENSISRAEPNLKMDYISLLFWRASTMAFFSRVYFM